MGKYHLGQYANRWWNDMKGGNLPLANKAKRKKTNKIRTWTNIHPFPRRWEWKSAKRDQPRENWNQLSQMKGMSSLTKRKATIVLKPGQAGLPESQPTQVGIGSGLRTNRESQNPRWPSGLTRQDPIKNLVAIHWLFFFLLKQCHFDFKKS